MHFLGRQASSGHNNLIYAGPWGKWLSIVFFFLVFFLNLAHNAVCKFCIQYNKLFVSDQCVIDTYQTIGPTLVSLMNILIICSNCRFKQIFFHRTSLVLGMGQLVFWGPVSFFGGASQFFWGPVSFQIYWPPRATGPTGLMSRPDTIHRFYIQTRTFMPSVDTFTGLFVDVAGHSQSTVRKSSIHCSSNHIRVSRRGILGDEK